MIEGAVSAVRWRASPPAIARIVAGPLAWSARMLETRVATVCGKAVATARTKRPHGTLLRMEGFEFWQFNHVLGREHWSSVRRFDTPRAAMQFAEEVIKTLP